VLSCSEFLSHTPDHGTYTTLENHLVEVAKNAADLCKSHDEATRHAAYCAGLLHDLGKLNPWYQELFCKKLKNPNLGDCTLNALKLDLSRRYGRRQHAIFSCMLAWCLLSGTNNPHPDTTEHIVRAILCHHGCLRYGLGFGTHDKQFKKSQRETSGNWEIFQARARARREYPNWFDWEWASESFAERQDIGNYGDSKHSIEEYLRGRIVFSALLQGDYKSFPTNKKQAQTCKFGKRMCIDAKKAYGNNTDLSLPINQLRDTFQKNAILKYDTDKCKDKRMTIIEAPTGIGKTALLLEIMSRHANENTLDHCYYFAPLLALNNSFVELVKHKNVIPRDVHKFVLTYNYAYKGTLNPEGDKTSTEDDLEESDFRKYNFAHEAFQYPLVITTTQRLLLTLYANHRASAMKLVSLAKSLIIIDEIQTIPRFMRQTTMALLDRLCKECDSRVVLASATVPAELKKIYSVGMSTKEKDKYLELTSRTIDLDKEVVASDVASVASNSPLVMFNTRRKAAEFYDKISTIDENVSYLSTGLTRGERLACINLLVNEKKDMVPGKWPHQIVVSTQVLEAGVDASFGRIWRELAPMDSIVQAMGRLDRGAEMCGKAKITIFGEYDPKDTFPYDSLDVKTTYEMLTELRNAQEGAFSSNKLYEKLDNYYNLTMKKNKDVLEQKEKFENYVKKQHYEMVWNMVAHTIGSYNIPIIIPRSNEEWQTIHSKLKDTIAPQKSTREHKMKYARARRNTYTAYSMMVAEFPGNKKQMCKIKHMLDEDLLECGMAFPKKDSVEMLYNRGGMGLDIQFLRSKSLH